MNTNFSSEMTMPRIFSVETVLGCNLRCPECALGAGLVRRAKGIMPFDRFKTIAEKIKPYCQYLYLHIWGEPMLHPDIFRIIEYASTFTKTNISTNAVCLNQEKAEQLVLSGVTDVIVSIDGFSQEVYEQYRMGGDVDKALKMLKHMALCNQRHGQRVRIQPQFIVFAHNQHEQSQFADYCREIGLKALFKAPYIRSESRYRIADDPRHRRPAYTDLPSLKQAMRHCNDAREVMTILVDGTCVMCCYDHNARTNYGNLAEKSVPEIWNGAAYRKDRQSIIDGNPPAFCLDHCLQWTLSPEATASAPTWQCVHSFPSAAKEPAGKGWGQRRPYRPKIQSPAAALNHARDCFRNQRFNDAFDLYESLAVAYPQHAVQVLAELYDQYQKLPTQDRYTLYQSRHYEFGIRPGDRVLDIGSGHIPFEKATHLADISVNDNHYGRAGQPFKLVEGKPVYECNIESLQFGDKEFDFVYCSHVLEHVNSPERACNELIRVGKRGFIETPTRSKDIWLNTAKMSNHRWYVHAWEGKLIFRQYRPAELEGFATSLLLNMHAAPQTLREKAFSALIYLKANLVNTMLLWEDTFTYEVHRIETGNDQESMNPISSGYADSNPLQATI